MITECKMQNAPILIRFYKYSTIMNSLFINCKFNSYVVEINLHKMINPFVFWGKYENANRFQSLCFTLWCVDVLRFPIHYLAFSAE